MTCDSLALTTLVRKDALIRSIATASIHGTVLFDVVQPRMRSAAINRARSRIREQCLALHQTILPEKIVASQASHRANLDTMMVLDLQRFV
jgi:hypothetical protein